MVCILFQKFSDVTQQFVGLGKLINILKMHHRNPMKISQPPLPIQTPLVAYDNLSKVELRSLLKSRDQELFENKEYLRNVQNQYNQKMGLLKLRIQDQIAQNQKAVKAFGNITEIIITIISKFQGFDQVTNRESLVSLANTIRSSIVSRPASFSKSLDQEVIQSQFSCIDEIVSETIKLLEYLSKLTEDMVKVNLNLKAEFTNRSKPTQPKINPVSKNPKMPKQIEFNLNQTQKIFKEDNLEPNFQLKQSARMSDGVIKSWTEQVAGLKQQVKTKIHEAKKLKKLLQEEQLRRLEILKNIANSLSEQTFMKVTKMNKQELVQHIKLINYRMRELEKDKRQMFAKSKVDRELDQRKFQDLLDQLKQLKTKKINMSVA